MTVTDICHYCGWAGRDGHAPNCAKIILGRDHPVNTPEALARDSVADTLADRQSVYGSPSVNFTRIANLINAVLEKKLTVPLTAVDVAMIQLCIKLGRLIQSPTHEDTIHDIQGYARCLEQIIREGGPAD